MVFKKGNQLWVNRNLERHRKSISDAKKKLGCWKGKQNPKWNGGVTIRHGYRYLLCPMHPMATDSGYVLEHRLIMEQYLGRLLDPKEMVHHINGNKLDNYIQNLKLYSSTGKHFINEHLKARDARGRFF